MVFSQIVTVTQTVTTPVLETVYRTQVQPTYITNTQTQYVTATCPSEGYSYPSPSGNSGYGSYGTVVPGVSSQYDSSGGPGYYGPFYGPYVASPNPPAYPKKKSFLHRLMGL